MAIYENPGFPNPGVSQSLRSFSSAFENDPRNKNNLSSSKNSLNKDAQGWGGGTRRFGPSQSFMPLLFLISPVHPFERGSTSAELKVTGPNLRFPAVFCENLRFSAVSCALQMLEFPEEGVNLRKSAVSAKICVLGSLSLSLSP